MTQESKSQKRILELEDEIKKNRRNYLQQMKAKDREIYTLEAEINELIRENGVLQQQCSD